MKVKSTSSRKEKASKSPGIAEINSKDSDDIDVEEDILTGMGISRKSIQ